MYPSKEDFRRAVSGRVGRYVSPREIAGLLGSKGWPFTLEHVSMVADSLEEGGLPPHWADRVIDPDISEERSAFVRVAGRGDMVQEAKEAILASTAEAVMCRAWDDIEDAVEQGDASVANGVDIDALGEYVAKIRNLIDTLGLDGSWASYIHNLVRPGGTFLRVRLDSQRAVGSVMEASRGSYRAIVELRLEQGALKTEAKKELDRIWPEAQKLIGKRRVSRERAFPTRERNHRWLYLAHCEGWTIAQIAQSPEGLGKSRSTIEQAVSKAAEHLGLLRERGRPTLAV